MINVVKKSPDVSGIYIGRGSPLGNPYDWTGSNHPQVKFQVKDRATAIQQYEEYLALSVIKGDPDICNAIRDIQIKNFKGELVNLVCFCYPLPCHGEVIRDYVKTNLNVINWFSNMRKFDEPLTYQGADYWTPENFFQAMKTKDLAVRKNIARMTPFKSKTFARTIELREDWEDIKLQVMKHALRHKFSEGTRWGELLKNSQEELIEWNNWGDEFWGVDIYSENGANHLGQLLTDIRNERQRS